MTRACNDLITSESSFSILPEVSESSQRLWNDVHDQQPYCRTFSQHCCCVRSRLCAHLPEDIIDRIKVMECATTRFVVWQEGVEPCIRASETVLGNLQPCTTKVVTCGMVQHTSFGKLVQDHCTS